MVRLLVTALITNGYEKEIEVCDSLENTPVSHVSQNDYFKRGGEPLRAPLGVATRMILIAQY